MDTRLVVALAQNSYHVPHAVVSLSLSLDTPCVGVGLMGCVAEATAAVGVERGVCFVCIPSCSILVSLDRRHSLERFCFPSFEPGRSL